MFYTFIKVFFTKKVNISTIQSKLKKNQIMSISKKSMAKRDRKCTVY